MRQHLIKRVFVRRTDQQALPTNFEHHGLPRLHVQRFPDLPGNHQSNAVAEVSENGFHGNAPQSYVAELRGSRNDAPNGI